MLLRMIFGFKGYIIAGAIATAVAAGGYLYWKNMTQRIQLLETQKAIAVDANNSLQNTLDRVQSEQLRLEQLRNNLQTALEDAASGKQDLQRILNKHDLENLSKEKPALIEKRVNDATKDIFRQLERDTSR